MALFKVVGMQLHEDLGLYGQYEKKSFFFSCQTHRRIVLYLGSPQHSMGKKCMET